MRSIPYYRIQLGERRCVVRFRVRVLDHEQPYPEATHEVTCSIELDGHHASAGLAWCHINDVFDPRRGQELALRRALNGLRLTKEERAKVWAAFVEDKLWHELQALRRQAERAERTLNGHRDKHGGSAFELSIPLHEFVAGAPTDALKEELHYMTMRMPASPEFTMDAYIVGGTNPHPKQVQALDPNGAREREPKRKGGR